MIELNKENRILSARISARELADRALIWFYTPDTEMVYRDIREEQIHKYFLEIADHLGYDVILRSAEEVHHDIG